MRLSRSLPFLLPGAVACALCGAAAAEPVTYVLDPDHSFVQFEVLHFGTSTIRGRIGPATGSVVLDRAADSGKGTGSVNLRVATATVSTGFRPFDARLREADLLASAAFPEAYFVATQFQLGSGGGVAEVRGEFTWRGSSQPLSLVATRFACRQDARLAAEVCGGDFDGTVSRSAYGATFGLPFIADAVQLRVQVEGIRR